MIFGFCLDFSVVFFPLKFCIMNLDREGGGRFINESAFSISHAPGKEWRKFP